MTQQITEVFDPPLPTDSAEAFDTKAFGIVAKLNPWATEANALAVEVNENTLAAAQSAEDADGAAGVATGAANASSQAALLASQWAAKTDGPVAAGEYSAKYYAQVAQATVATIPEGTINDSAISPTSVYSSTKVEASFLRKAGGVATGLKYATSPLGNITGATSINLATAQSFTATVTGNTALSFTNPPSANEMQVVQLRLTNGGAFAIDWPAGTQFDMKKKPTFTASGVDDLGLKFDSAGVCTVVVIGLDVGVAA